LCAQEKQFGADRFQALAFRIAGPRPGSGARLMDAAPRVNRPTGDTARRRESATRPSRLHRQRRLHLSADGTAICDLPVDAYCATCACPVLRHQQRRCTADRRRDILREDCDAGVDNGFALNTKRNAAAQM
jgi:hypothetical protein